jgi:hypothetical protein
MSKVKRTLYHIDGYTYMQRIQLPGKVNEMLKKIRKTFRTQRRLDGRGTKFHKELMIYLYTQAPTHSQSTGSYTKYLGFTRMRSQRGAISVPYNVCFGTTQIAKTEPTLFCKDGLKLAFGHVPRKFYAVIQ